MNKDRLVVLQTSTADREQWNNLAFKASEGTFFHSFDWSEVIRIYGEKTGFFVPRHVFVVNKEFNEIVGVLPLFLDRKHHLVSLPFGDYGGPCLIPSANKEVVFKLLFEKAEETAKKEASEIRLKSLPKEYSNWLRAHQYAVHPFMYTFLLPIDGLTLDHLWRRFRRDTKRGIKKAKEEGVVIEEMQEKELMKDYYQIYTLSMKNGATVRPFVFFEALWDTLSQKQPLHVLLAKCQGKYIAGLIFLSWKKRLHIYGNVSLPQYRNLRPNDLLYYEVVRWGVERNFQVVDFGLTPLNRNSGLYQFKERWGTSPALLFLTSKRYGLTTTLLQKTYASYLLNFLKNKLRRKKYV